MKGIVPTLTDKERSVSLCLCVRDQTPLPLLALLQAPVAVPSEDCIAEQTVSFLRKWGATYPSVYSQHLVKTNSWQMLNYFFAEKF